MASSMSSRNTNTSQMEKSGDMTAEEKKNEKKGLMFYFFLTSSILSLCLYYILYQAFNPWIVQIGDSSYRGPEVCDTKPADNMKCLGMAFLTMLGTVLLAGLFYGAMKQ